MNLDFAMASLGWAAAAYAVTGAMQIPRWVGRIRSLPRSDQLVALAALLLFLGMFVWWSRTGAAEASESSSLFQLFCFAAAGALLILTALTHPIRIAHGSYPAFFLCLYATTAVASAAASPDFLFSMYKASTIFLDLLLGLVAIAVLRSNNCELLLLRIVIALISMLVFLETLGIIYYREEAFRPLEGSALALIISGPLPYLNANELGFLSGVAMIIGITALASAETIVLKMFYLAQVTMASILLFLAQARTTLAGILILFLIMATLIPRVRSYCSLLLVVLAASMMFGYMKEPVSLQMLLQSINEYFRRGASWEELETMSGRTDLWAAGIEMFRDRPFFGHGFEAGVRFRGSEYGLSSGLHMHNAHMQVLVNTGLLGYAAWCGFIGSLFVVFFRRLTLWMRISSWRAPDGLFLAGIFLVLLLTGLKTLTASTLVSHQPAMLIAIGVLVYSSLAPTTLQLRSPADFAGTDSGPYFVRRT